MSWFDRWLEREPRDPFSPLSPLEQQQYDVQLNMGGALIFGLEARNERYRFVEHCARVSHLVRGMAAAFALREDDRDDVTTAAQLHEIGMLTLPDGLLERPGPLRAGELAQVRSQAVIGARIVALTHHPRTARLIQFQYTDFETLRGYVADEAELLLAGMLRVADVFDTLSHPRPYQRNITQAHRESVLVTGAGTRFHPQAVSVLFQVAKRG